MTLICPASSSFYSFHLLLLNLQINKRKQYCIRISNQWLLYYKWEKEDHTWQHSEFPPPLWHQIQAKPRHLELPTEPCCTPESQEINHIWFQITPRALLNTCITRHVSHLFPNHPCSPVLHLHHIYHTFPNNPQSPVEHLHHKTFTTPITKLPPQYWSTDRLTGLLVKASASWLSCISDLKTGTLEATPPGTWRYRVSTGTGWPGVSIPWPGEIESLICNFYLSVAPCTLVWAEPSLRYTSMLLGH